MDWRSMRRMGNKDPSDIKYFREIKERFYEEKPHGR